jgi:GntR family transcriptional regulator
MVPVMTAGGGADGEPPRFDPSSVIPLFEQVAAYLADRIESGELAPGQKLPAERDMAGDLGVAYQTVRRAVQELRRRGLIVSRVGKGTFVARRHAS